MRKLMLLTGALLLFFLTAYAWAFKASAHSFHTGNNVTLNQAEPINQTVFAAGRTLDISSEVFGDVICGGQTVNITGAVHGDVICAGQTVHVTGKVDGDVRLAGQTVTIGAEVGGNATIGGQSFVLESSGKIGGDVTIGSTDATFNGAIGRDLAIGGSTVTITSSVGRNIKGSVNNLVLSSGAKVAGDINYTSSKDLSKADGAVIGGKVSRTEPTKVAKSKRGAVFGFGFGWFVYWFLAMLLIAMVVALLFPRMLQAVTDKAMPRPWKALLVGFLANIAAPVVFALVAVSVIGIPLALMFGFMWLAALILSGPLFGFYVGRLILPESRHALTIMLVGASVLLLLYFIPIVGFIAFLATLWVGTGMLLLEIFGRTPKPSYQLVTPTKRKK